MENRDGPIKGRKVNRLDCISLNGNDSTYFTVEGYFVDHPILTSCGIFEYQNPDGSIKRELRLPEHVFAEKSLNSYRGKPIIITHDAGKITKENVESEQIGTIMSAGYQDNEDVRAEILIHNADKMQECGLRELSLGYSTTLIEEPGEWNGEPYDAIQTDIVINHLALVEEARAGAQARLNIDGSDKEILKGEKIMVQYTTSRADGDNVELTPEELEEAKAMFLAAKANKDCGENKDGDEPTETPTESKEGDEPKAEEPAQEPEANKDEENAEQPAEEPAENKDDEDLIGKVIEVLNKVIADLQGTKTDSADTEEEPEKNDGADDESESLNQDSADEIVRQRIALCRVGDKLNLDGLDTMPLIDGKKAIIKKVYPDIRMDGKDVSYINAMYDIAVGEVNREKTVSDQLGQIFNGDGKPQANMTMAQSARQRMIEREGGNE